MLVNNKKMSTKVKRITVKLKSPNPLFEKWLIEWRDKAKENDSKMQHTFNIALKSLKKYPVPLNSGRECIILKGFGNKLCEMLDKKLKDHKTNNSNADTTIDYDYIETIAPKLKKKRTPKKSPKINKSYVPTYRSGAYAILLTLFKKSQEPNFVGYMTKNEITESARDLCDKSFTKPDPGSFYTAWSSMAQLISKKLIEKKSSPPKFSLTPEGFEVALKLLNITENNTNEDNIDILSCSDNQTQKTSLNININKDLDSENCELIKKNVNNGPILVDKKNSVPEENLSNHNSSITETVLFAPKSFDIILLVDNQETEGKKKDALDDDTKYELNQTGIKYEIRHLKVGDFTWICRQRETENELILPYIVERKRLDDLASSIKDGRFHEQKSRLKQCGAKNLIYVIETIGRNVESFGGLPMSTLYQAATNTLVQDGFQVKFTNSHKHTMCYLAQFSRYLVKYYHDKTIMSCSQEDLTNHNLSDDLISMMTFKEFNKSSSKQKDFTVKEMFIKQLVQLKGLSLDKAIAITDKYSTPRLLIDEYEKIGPRFGPLLLSKITYGPWKRTVGAVISKILYQLYMQDHLL